MQHTSVSHILEHSCVSEESPKFNRNSFSKFANQTSPIVPSAPARAGRSINLIDLISDWQFSDSAMYFWLLYSQKCSEVSSLRIYHLSSAISLTKKQRNDRVFSPYSASLHIVPCGTSASRAEQEYFPTTTMEIERKVPLVVITSQSANILERKRIAVSLFAEACPCALSNKFLMDRDPRRLSMDTLFRSYIGNAETSCSPPSVS